MPLGLRAFLTALTVVAALSGGSAAAARGGSPTLRAGTHELPGGVRVQLQAAGATIHLADPVSGVPLRGRMAIGARELRELGTDPYPHYHQLRALGRTGLLRGTLGAARRVVDPATGDHLTRGFHDIRGLGGTPYFVGVNGGIISKRVRSGGVGRILDPVGRRELRVSHVGTPLLLGRDLVRLTLLDGTTRDVDLSDRAQWSGLNLTR